MPNLTSLSLNELRKSNKGQLVSAVAASLNAMSKQELIEFLMDSKEFAEPDQIAYWPDKQFKHKITVIKDFLGARIKTVLVEWSYYPKGEVDIIQTTELNAVDNVVKHTEIKHFTDGRQPIRR